MSRCIMVIGLPRTGTSAAAGCLQMMGVAMGDDPETLQIGDPFNEKGYFEDAEWKALNESVTGRRYEAYNPDVLPDDVLKTYRTLIRKRCSKYLLWGVKGTRFCFTGRHVLPILIEECDVRLIITQRELNASISSLYAHSQAAYYGMEKRTLPEIIEVIKVWHTALCELITDHIPRTAVSCKYILYTNLVNSPDWIVPELARFAFEGSGVNPDIQAGIEFIDKRLNHWDNNGTSSYLHS